MSTITTGEAVFLGVAAVGAAALAASIIRRSKPASIQRGWRRYGSTAMENPTSRKRGRGRSRVQSVLFSRSHGWTPSTAKRWARHEGFHAGKVDETENYIRLRQESPTHFARIRTKTLSASKGIKAAIGFPR